MGKNLGVSLAKRDDPIFSEGPSFYTRPSDRGSTPSTKSSTKSTASGSGPASKATAPTPKDPEAK
jgi:hypothetical protein